MPVQEKFFDITFKEDGTFEVEAIGYKGKSCEEDINTLLKNVGQVISSKKKHEFYKEEEKVRVHGRVGG